MKYALSRLTGTTSTCTIDTIQYILEGGEADNSAKYKVVGFGTRWPCAAKTKLGFGVIGKGFWSFLAAKSDRKSFKQEITQTTLWSSQW